jgi:hypothetical protein
VLRSAPVPKRVIAKKRCRAMVEPPEKNTNGNPNLLTRLNLLFSDQERKTGRASALFSIVLFRHLPELSFDVDIFLFGHRAVVLIVSLFALFCFSLELERLGAALGNDQRK